MKKDFVPREIGKFNNFAANFSAKLDEIASELNIKPAMVAVTKESIENHRKAFRRMYELKAELASAVEDHRIKRKHVTNEIRRISTILKNTKGYNSAMGEVLMMVCSDVTKTPEEEMKPELKVVFNGHGIEVKFRKNHAEALKLFAKYGDSEFKEIGVAHTNKYLDETPKQNSDQPEKREYYGVYLNDYKEIGFKSNVVRVVVP